MLTLNKKGEKVIVPARYLMRPHGKDQGFDKEYGGCYNARLDSLLTVPWWKDVFGKRHGLMLVKKFYENVPRTLYQKNFSLSESHAKASNLVLCFEPDSVEYMYIPTLWDFWEGKGPSLLSAALITDEPTAEVARAGHNRSPVFLKESAIDDWLNVSAYSPEEFLRILAEREFPHYSHRVLDVA